MAERNWTREQIEAITCSANDILVSAGAGSGKTAVLTERIIRRLCDESNPVDITRMLIVTFTNAATEELRDRVAVALRARLAAEPENRRLRRQLMLLPSAHIYTISSFCLGIVRANLSALGLPAGLRVCDEPESELLAAEVMEQVIDGFYEGIFDCPVDFGEFCDAFVSDRDDRLAVLLLDLYKKLREYIAGVELLLNNAETLRAAAEGDTDFMTTPWGRSIASELRTQLGYYIAVLGRALDMFAADEKLTNAYYNQFANDLKFAKQLDLMLAGGADYATLREHVGGYQNQRLGSLRNYEKTPELELYRKVRSDFASSTGFVRKIYAKYFSIEPELLRGVLSDCARQCETFYAVLSVFEQRFLAEKRRRAIVDFNDLERFAYRLLCTDDGSISDTAAAVAAEYDELYIDEYQDTNELEDKIFAALAKASATGQPSDRTRFMVGDVKQSIYGFRGAEPSLFASYRSDPAVKTLFLRTNFRCDRAIIDFANRISEHIFTGTGSEVEFGEGDKLHFGKPSGSKDYPVRVLIFDSAKDDEETGEKETHTDDDDEGIEIGEPIEMLAEQKEYGEPEFVADEIARLIESGEYKPGDIAILLRSTESRAVVYERALRARGIGSVGGAADFFERPEVSAMMCILCSVNNPSRDIYLAGALRSPFFGFELDDLVHIRRFMPPPGDELPFYFGGDAEDGFGDGDTPDIGVPGEDTVADWEGKAGSTAAVGDAETGMYSAGTIESDPEGGAELREGTGADENGGGTPPDAKAASLYEALVHYTKTTGFEKGRRFLEKLALYRKYAEANPADRVVRFIYRDIGAHAFAAGGGDPAEVTARRRNLMRLYELARTFEHGQFRGLGSFIEYIEGLLESGRMQTPPPNATEPGVKIMSIHKSKGLEFPVVFLCDCARRFNIKDTQKPVLFDSKLGASAKLGDASGFGSIDTPVRTATALRITRRIRHEEMRALYVAITRAKERLYVTATLNEPAKLLDKAEIAAKHLPADARAAEVMGASNFISWIAGALGGRDNDYTKLEIFDASADLPERHAVGQAKPAAAPDGDADNVQEQMTSDGSDATETAERHLPGTAGLADVPLTAEPAFDGQVPYAQDESAIAPLSGEAESRPTAAGSSIDGQVPPDDGKVEKYKAIFERRLSFSYRWKPLEKLPAKLSVSDLYPSILDEGEGDGTLDLSDTSALYELAPELADIAVGGEAGGQPAGSKFGPPRFLSDDPEPVAAAERGTATHIFMQFCDFDYVEGYGVEAELERLVAGRFMTATHAELVDVREIERFFRSPLYADMRAAKSLYREVRFNVRLPASEFTQDENLQKLLAGELVLVQGVIDCYYETKDGRLRLVDYKTDYIPRELRTDIRKAEQLLVNHHARQLGYYARAIEKLTGRQVERSIIYSFALGKPIYIN